ncbi:MAG: hypothetical protein K6C94_00220 [Candidatus Gastranaerophilales bacterium]|nr:hypothetical protein [Candidatus Gastranaerophilales bacterium]
MNFSDYVMKRLSSLQQVGKTGETGNTTGKTSEEALKNLSVFSSLSAEDLAKIDFEQLLTTGVGSDDEALNNILKSFLEIEGVQKAADGDENGEMSAEEAQAFIQSVLGKDGDASNISMEDLEAVVQELGIDLDALAATMDEVLNEDKKEDEVKEKEEEITPEKIKEAEENAHPEKTEKPSAAQAAGGAGSAGRSGGAGGAGSTGGASTKKTEEAKGETPEEIKQQIQEKNDEIDKIEGDADKEIQDQEKAKEDAMKKYGVSDEELKEYKEQEEKIDNEIKENEKGIKDQDKVISDANSTIKSNESYIKDIDAQIDSNKEAMSGLEGEDVASQKAEIESKISNLENEKKAKEEENEKLKNETIKNAEEEKQKLETKNQELEKQKEELLSKTLSESKGFCAGMPSDAKKGVTEQIKQYDEKISDIKEKRDKDVSEVQKEVTKLEAKLKTAEAKNDRNNFLKENAANKFDFDFEECLSDYNKQELAQLKKTFEEHREEYEKVAEATGVPAELICAIHYREGSCNFGTYLHNGDPLGQPTTHVPAGKNFSDWTEAAIDAIKSQNPEIIKDGDFDSCMEFAERYNGLGYRNRGLASPYVWAGTTTYTGGMYVADGQFSSTAKDKRVGVAVMMKYLYS